MHHLQGVREQYNGKRQRKVPNLSLPGHACVSAEEAEAKRVIVAVELVYYVYSTV
jgi:hypothetical protein